MKASHRHKRILSALLLMLYGFIITPVALWHSHSCDGQAAYCKDAPSPGKQAAGADDACAICKHVYSSHVAAESSELEPAAVEYRQYDASFRKSIPYIFTGHADTRGSPAIAV